MKKAFEIFAWTFLAITSFVGSCYLPEVFASRYCEKGYQKCCDTCRCRENCEPMEKNQ